MSKRTSDDSDCSFVDGILHGDAAVRSVIANAERLASTELRALGIAAKIPAAMCGDGSDAPSVVFAAKFFGGKRWDQFRQLVDSAANSSVN